MIIWYTLKRATWCARFLLEDDELNQITDINKQMNGLIDDSKIAENILWTPKDFKFSNMFGNKSSPSFFLSD